MPTETANPLESTARQPTWDGPYTEPLAQGGRLFYRCTECGAEVLAGHREHGSHRPGCSLA